jgi:hypothetical protein
MLRQPSKRDNAQRELGEVGTADSSDIRSFTETVSIVKARLLSGQSVRQIDYPKNLRTAIIGSIALIRDELPVRCRWVTVRESYLNETRLRAKVYWIPGEYLIDSEDRI